MFRYEVIPFSGATPVKKLFLRGQRVNSSVRQVTLHSLDISAGQPAKLPRSQSFASVKGEVIVTSIQHRDGGRLMRMFNPLSRRATVEMAGVKSVQSLRLDGRDDGQTIIERRGNSCFVGLGAKRIATLLMSPS